MTSPAPPRPAPAVRSGASRIVWLVAGFVAVGIGGIGLVVPGLPTTVFFIVAASCFARSSPRFERWVLDLPGVGAMVRDHRNGLGMPRRAKWIAQAMMWTAILLSSLALRQRPVLVAVLVAVGLVGSAYIGWRVPTRERVLANRQELEAVGGAELSSVAGGGAEPAARPTTGSEAHGGGRRGRRR